MQVDPMCVLCNCDVESVHHLFSSCPYFDRIRAASPFHLQRDWSLCQSGNFFVEDLVAVQKKVAVLYLSIAVYFTWKERNSRMHHDGKSQPTLATVRKVKEMLREKLFSCRNFTSKAARDNSLISILF